MEGALHEYKERPGACAACGNSPVNHLSTYVTNTLGVWSGARRFQAAMPSWLEARLSRFVTRVDDFVHRALALLPVTRFSRDIQKAATYRSQVIWEEAERRGILMEQMVLLGAYTEVYRARIHGSWHYFHSLPVPADRDVADRGWIDDKFALKVALAHAGIAIPRAASVTALSYARERFRELGVSVVVKPRSGSRGRHTTVNITTEADLERAFRSSQQLCHYVCIEEYLPGSVCRATVVNGTLVGFLQGLPPQVVGDGRSSIQMLIDEANRTRPDRVQEIVIVDEHKQFLARGGYSLESIPAAGERVTLTHRTGRLFGGRTREMLGSEHPALRAQLERAAATIGSPLVGFDCVIPDPSADPATQRWGIIEANTLPYIDLHYLPLEGTPSPVAAAVWNLWGDRVSDSGAIIST